MKTRASHLERGLRELLNDRTGEGLARKLYEHPLVFSLYKGDYRTDSRTGGRILGANLPSYIPSKNFALALMDIVARGPVSAASSPPTGGLVPKTASNNSEAITMESLRAGVRNLGNEPIARAILSALDIAQGDLDRARVNLEEWYDSAMDRVSGWYRRSTQWIVFAMALLLAVGLNVNSIKIADYLYRSDTPRANLVTQAAQAPAPTGGAVVNGSGTSVDPSLAALLDPKLGLPIGWNYLTRPDLNASTFDVLTFWLTLYAGWLITAFAATLGAPFWFDMMNKVMVIRSTVKPHEKSPEEASEDRQQKYDQPRGLPPVQPSRPAAPQGLIERRQSPQLSYGEPVEVDGCGHVDAPQTEDKDLPPAQGGIK